MYRLFTISMIALLLFSCGKDETNESAASGTSSLKDINTLADYDAQIQSGISLMFFHATWCSICKTQRPAVENTSIAAELNVVKFGQIDTDKNSDILKKYDIQGQPVILIYKDGVEKQRLLGSGHSQQKLTDILKGLL